MGEIRSFLCTMTVALAVVLLSATAPGAQLQHAQLPTNQATEGEKLFMQILNRYPKLDPVYRKPMLLCAATTAPYVALSVPIGEWKSLSEYQKHLLCLYTKSFMSKIKNHPFSYIPSGLSQSAPIAPMVRKYAYAMSSSNWEIDGCRITSDGRDMDYVVTLVKGSKDKRQSTEALAPPSTPRSAGNTVQLHQILKPGYPVCVSEAALDKFVQFVVQNDKAAAGALLMSRECTESNGLTVYVEDVGLFSGKVKVRIKGRTHSFWTLREAVF